MFEELESLFMAMISFLRNKTQEFSGENIKGQIIKKIGLPYNLFEKSIRKLLALNNKIETVDPEKKPNELSLKKYQCLDVLMKMFEQISIRRKEFKDFIELSKTGEHGPISKEFENAEEDFLKLKSLLKITFEDEDEDSLSEIEIIQDKLIEVKSQNKNESFGEANLSGATSVIDNFQVDKVSLGKELVIIKPYNILRKDSNQIDVVFDMNALDNLEGTHLSLNDSEEIHPLIISLVFNTGSFTDDSTEFIREIRLANKNPNWSVSSKKNKLLSHKKSQKFYRSLSSDKKPSPFKLQSTITNFFLKNKNSNKKNSFLKKLKMVKNEEIPSIKTLQSGGVNSFILTTPTQNISKELLGSKIKVSDTVSYYTYCIVYLY